MSNKSVPLSVRLSPDEADFVSTLKIEEARTSSEKLRAIISAARKRNLGTGDFSSALHLAQESVNPTLNILKTNENKHRMHSELLSRVGDWLPDCLAFLTACNGTAIDLTEDELRDIEKDLADRIGVLVQSVLQMVITKNGPCYDTEHLRTALQPAIELANIIKQQEVNYGQ